MSIKLQIKNREEETLFSLGSIAPISYLYSYQTPITSQAKSSYCQSFLQIDGHFNADITEEYPMFAIWANTSWTPTNSMREYYRDVLIEEIRAGAVIRSIRFPKAYVVEYHEIADINEDNTLAFKILLAQKIDCIDEIEIDGKSRKLQEEQKKEEKQNNKKEEYTVVSHAYKTPSGINKLNTAIAGISLALNLVFQLEAPTTNNNKIYPHYAEDGYLTLGAGFIVDSPERAAQYGLDWDELKRIKSIYDDSKNQKFSPEKRKQLADKARNDMQYYITTLKPDSPAICTKEKARAMLQTELINTYTQKVQKAIDKYDSRETYTRNQIAALTSVVFNGNDTTDPNSVSYWLIRKSKKDALRVVAEAVDAGHYKGQSGKLRRRLIEINLFFNNDYNFYNDVAALARQVGYTGSLTVG